MTETDYTADVIAVAPEGRVLLVQRRWDPFTGRWALPGGYTEPGEDSRMAAVRKVEEVM